MRYSRDALAAIAECIDTLRGASTIIQTKMELGLEAADCASRQFQVDCIARDVTHAFVGVMREFMELGSSVDCIALKDLPDMQTTIRQLFEDAADKPWRDTRADARTNNLIAAE